VHELRVSRVAGGAAARADPEDQPPAAMTSTVAAILASTAGGRIRLLVTITPRRSRLGCAARAANSVQASRAAPVTSPRSGTR
jgi:C4-dicarboxylate transporter